MNLKTTRAQRERFVYAMSKCADEGCLVCQAHADANALEDRVAELEAALRKCVAQFENMDENQPQDSGCIVCTDGTVPNDRNTGRCGYHSAVHALAEWRPKVNAVLDKYGVKE